MSGTDGGAPATYADGMAVSFADQAGVANSVVQLDSEVSPSSMLVRNSTTRYELTGTGEITNTAVTKEGTGTLVLGTSSILGTVLLWLCRRVFWHSVMIRPFPARG